VRSRPHNPSVAGSSPPRPTRNAEASSHQARPQRSSAVFSERSISGWGLRESLAALHFAERQTSVCFMTGYLAHRHFEAGRLRPSEHGLHSTAAPAAHKVLDLLHVRLAIIRFAH
jgi:hypothetical protein